MKEELIHILDQSVCLTRRQMKDYLSGTMLPEEMHAAEVHLSSCPLCHMALEGFSAHTDEALAAISELNSGFLKDHFARTAPQIHLNSMAPAAAMTRQKRKGQSISFLRIGSVAAAVALGFGIMWYLKNVNQAQDKALARLSPAEKGPVVVTAPPSHTETDQPALKVNTPPPAVVLNEPVKEEAPAPKQKATLAAVQQTAANSDMDAEKKEVTAANADGYMAYSPAAKSAVEEMKPAMTPPAPSPANNAPAISAGTVTVPGNVAAYTTTDQATGNVITESQNLARAESSTKRFSVPTAALAKNKAEKKEEADSRSHMEQGDDLFEKGKYGSAVAHYREEMNSGNRNNRHQAAIMAARCYLNLGQKQRAIQLLQGVLADGGPQKRIAKKMLRDLQVGE